MKQERRDGENVQVLDEIETNKARNALEEFLVCLGTYCPENFMHTVLQESTSYTWVMNRVKETFNLDTRGASFLAGCDIKVDFGEDGQTYQQAYQAVKEFYCSSLLKKGDKFKGKALDKDEPLTPFGENILVEKWSCRPGAAFSMMTGQIWQTISGRFASKWKPCYRK